MARKKEGRAPGFVKQVDFARRLRKMLYEEAPRGDDGALCEPYRGLSDRMSVDIERAEKWLAAQGQPQKEDWSPDGT